ncbi:terminase large subunit [Acinetobacter radioresistens]|uniref:terminase large subunit n=1 Tax=Acinetobacter radioresistens TaxID=40216 RepID=UPI0021CD5CB9|nr:terminase large subunit [Acinetobacter radioresistens]MCU4517807.1 terminase large subunit [Acinetobacter radioresistens]
MRPIWKTSCPDWEEKIVKGQSLIPCKPLFPEEAEMALDVFKSLIVTDVLGQPTMGEITRPWVFEFVAAIFGAFSEDEQRRLIAEFFLLIPKKNTKSTLAAFIMLTALIMNDRNAAELIILAPTKEVADNSFGPIKEAINADPELKSLMNVSEHTKTVTHLETRATLKVVAAEANTVGGKKASWILIDELHLFQKNPHAASMFREATGGLASRPEGCVIYLTTQASEQPCGVFKQKLDYARDVRDGIKENNKFLPLIYEFPKQMIEDGEHLLKENFHIPNPNYGTSVDTEQLEYDFDQAKDGEETDFRDFLAKRLNVEIGLNLRANRWAGAEYWLKQKHVFTLDDIIEKSDVITMGIDGGGLDDLLGFAVLGRHAKSRKWWLWNHAWANKIAVERRKENAPKYADYEKEKSLTIVERIGDDLHQLGVIAKKVFDSGKLDRIGLDKMGMGGLVDGLLAAGIPEDNLIAVPQGHHLMGYILTAERKLAEGNLYHAGQGLMTWCVGNARIVMIGNSMRITKQESGVGKIDPLIASFNAIALMSMNPEPSQKDYNVYFI